MTTDIGWGWEGQESIRTYMCARVLCVLSVVAGRVDKGKGKKMRNSIKTIPSHPPRACVKCLLLFLLLSLGIVIDRPRGTDGQGRNRRGRGNGPTPAFKTTHTKLTTWIVDFAAFSNDRAPNALLHARPPAPARCRFSCCCRCRGSRPPAPSAPACRPPPPFPA